MSETIGVGGMVAIVAIGSPDERPSPRREKKPGFGQCTTPGLSKISRRSAASVPRPFFSFGEKTTKFEKGGPTNGRSR